MSNSKGVLSAALLLLAVAPVGAQQSGRYTLNGRSVAFYNLVGEVRVVAGTGGQTVVEVRPRGRDADQLRIENSALNGVPTLRVIFPDDDIIDPDMEDGSNTTLSVNDDGTFGNDRRGARRVRIHSGRRGSGVEAAVDLVVRLPAGVSLDGHIGVGTMSVNGSRSDLDLHTVAGDINVVGASGVFTLNSSSGNLVLDNTQGDARLESASGDVELRATRAQTIDVHVASGDITANDVEVPNLTLGSASGDLRLRGVHSQAVKTSTASGDLSIRESDVPDLQAESASGDVMVEITARVRRADVSTASGTVTVAIADNASLTVDAQANSGDVDLEIPLTLLGRRREGRIQGRIGSGAGQLTVEAASGSVRIVRLR